MAGGGVIATAKSVITDIATYRGRTCNALFDLVAGVKHDLVAFGEAFENFGLQAVLPADLDDLLMDDAVDHLKHGRFVRPRETMRWSAS